MRLTRSVSRRATAAFAAAGLLVGALIAPSAAYPAAGSLDPDKAAALSTRLGDRSAGTYLDASGKTVVTVTDAATARAVRASGAIAKLVTRGAGELAKVTADLDSSAGIVGTSWAVDPVTNQVVVSMDSTVTGADLARLESTVARHGAAARLERVPGTLGVLLNGGRAIFGGGFRCSLGFNVRSGNTFFLLTAGHCTNSAGQWFSNSSGSSSIGPRAGTSFPGNDYGIIRYDNSSLTHPSSVNLFNGTSRQITRAGNAFVGQSVQRSGSTTGVHGGTVTAVNATANYPQGRVTGLIRTTVCAEPGDSGGSLFSGSIALGITSGGSGDCSSGGITLFQPVTEPMSVFGVTIP
jgi:streptogrisin D